MVGCCLVLLWFLGDFEFLVWVLFGGLGALEVFVLLVILLFCSGFYIWVVGVFNGCWCFGLIWFGLG